MMGPLLWPLSTSHPCFSPCLPADCQNALGMASGYIADSQITASGQEGEFEVVVGAGSDSARTTQRWSKLDLSKSPPSMPRSGSPEETPEGASPLHQGCVTLLEAADPRRWAMLRAHPAGEQLTTSCSSSLCTLLAGPWAPKLARLHNSGSINAWSTGEGNPWIQVRGDLWPWVLLGAVPGHTLSGAPHRRTHVHGHQN